MNDKKVINVGGQAVIEGVMMRGADNLSTAIRRADGSIELFRQPFISKTSTVKLYGVPLIRGFVSLIEMFLIGLKTLTFSASRWEIDLAKEEAAQGKEVKKQSNARRKLEEIGSYIFAFGLAFLLFVLLPYKLAELIGLSKQNLYFNLCAGSIRIVFFVVYIWAISLMKDVKRLFRYHGAEHKNVHAFEKGVPLEIAEIQKMSTIHPRCGTSFMFFVLLVAILVFSITDALVSAFILHTTVPLALRISYHLLLTPLVSGISYEVLKFSGRKIDHPLVKLMTVPGMALQKITTQPPDDSMIEVALVAMKSALDMDYSEYNVKVLESINDPS